MNSTSVFKFTRTLRVTNTLYAVLYQVQSSKYLSCRKWIIVGKNQTKQHWHLLQLISPIFICLWFGCLYCMFESVDCLWVRLDFPEEKCLVQKIIKCKLWSASLKTLPNSKGPLLKKGLGHQTNIFLRACYGTFCTCAYCFSSFHTVLSRDKYYCKRQATQHGYILSLLGDGD